MKDSLVLMVRETPVYKYLKIPRFKSIDLPLMKVKLVDTLQRVTNKYIRVSLVYGPYEIKHSII